MNSAGSRPKSAKPTDSQKASRSTTAKTNKSDRSAAASTASTASRTASTDKSIAPAKADSAASIKKSVTIEEPPPQQQPPPPDPKDSDGSDGDSDDDDDDKDPQSPDGRQGMDTGAVAQNITQIKLRLNVTGPIEDFRSFRNAMRHPTAVLGLDTNGIIAGSKDNMFTQLTEEVLTGVADLQQAIDELCNWKNGLMRQNLPASMKYTLVMLFSKLFRANSSMHEPMFEMVRLIRLYSDTWREKYLALMELEDDYQRHRKALDIAIQKLEYQRIQHRRERREKVILRWERLVQHLMEVQGDAEGDDMQSLTALKEEFEDDLDDSVSNRDGKSGRGHSGHASKAGQNDGANNGLTFAVEGGIQFLSMYAPVTIEKMEKTLWSAFRRLMRHHHPNFRYIIAESRRFQFHPLYVTEFVKDAEKPKSHHLRLKRSRSTIEVSYLDQHKARRPEGLVRSNSFNALQEDELSFRRNANPRSEEEEFMLDDVPIVDRDAVDGLQVGPASENDSEAGQSEVSEGESDEGEEQVDAMDEFILQNKTESIIRFDELWNEKTENVLGNIDIDQTWFSLRDVMETTLLHTQQMHLTQLAHEEQVRKLEREIEYLRKKEAQLSKKQKRRDGTASAAEQSVSGGGNVDGQSTVEANRANQTAGTVTGTGTIIAETETTYEQSDGRTRSPSRNSNINQAHLKRMAKAIFILLLLLCRPKKGEIGSQYPEKSRLPAAWITSNSLPKYDCYHYHFH